MMSVSLRMLPWISDRQTGEYRDRTRTPKYIVIVAAASKYGDYFTGGVGSTLYLDEFSFVYDPAELGYK